MNGAAKEAQGQQADSVRTWSPASEPELSLAAESGFFRAMLSPGLLQLLVRVEPAAGDAKNQSAGTLFVRRSGSAGGGSPIVLRNDGWQRVTVFYGPGAWKGGQPPSVTLAAPGFVGTLSVASATHSAWPVGPGMSDAQLLGRLDLTRPELAAVRERTTAGDIPGATAALIRHFRTRKRPVWELPALPADTAGIEAAKLAADKVLRGETTMLSNSYIYPNGVIDWHFDPTKGGKFQTNEWIWSMNRHECASKLMLAYRLTGETRYVDYWAGLVRGWAREVPVLSTEWSGAPGSGWRLIEAGLRMGQFWPDAWGAFASSPALPDDVLIMMVKAFWEHGEFLARQPVVRGNFYVLGTAGLYTLASLLPEFSDAGRWRGEAIAGLRKYVMENTESDGGWYERSPSYHQWLVEKTATVLRMARLNGQLDGIPRDFRSHLSLMAEWNVRLSLPDRTVPALNDSSRLDLEKICAEAMRAEHPESGILKWGAVLAAGNQPGKPLLPASELMSSGYAVMRTSWAPDASCLIFDVGPMGGGHGHLDALNIIYAAGGKTALFDNTGGTYTASPFRAWAVSTASHNTVMVDGANQHRPKDSPQDPAGKLPADTPAPVFAETPGGIYASGWHVGGFGKDGAIPVRHRREIFFTTAGGAAVVCDTLMPKDTAEHSYDLRWHALTTRWQGGGAQQAVVPEMDGKPLLAVVPLEPPDEVLTSSGESEPQVLGWDLPKSTPPVPALTIRHLRKAAGPVVFLTVLVPGSLLANNTLPVVTGNSADGWRVNCGDGRAPLVVRLDAKEGYSKCRIEGGLLPAPVDFLRKP